MSSIALGGLGGVGGCSEALEGGVCTGKELSSLLLLEPNVVEGIVHLSSLPSPSVPFPSAALYTPAAPGHAHSNSSTMLLPRRQSARSREEREGGKEKVKKLN